LTSGGVRCWGRNSEGQLGDGTLTSRTTALSTDAVTGARGIGTGTTHACAIVGASGALRCWGRNDGGQLGDGTTATRNVPGNDVMSGVRAVAGGAAHTCVLLESGGVRCWGGNDKGQLGDGTTAPRLTPPAGD